MGTDMKLQIIGIAVAILGAGCASVPPNNQAHAAHPAKKSIHVVTESQNNHTLFAALDQRVYITHVDNASTNTLCFHWPDCYAQEVFVAPGRHYLKLKYAYFNTFANGTVWFDAQEGRSYMIRRRASGNGVQLWVEDTTTGRRVGGIPE